MYFFQSIGSNSKIFQLFNHLRQIPHNKLILFSLSNQHHILYRPNDFQCFTLHSIDNLLYTKVPITNHNPGLISENEEGLVSLVLVLKGMDQTVLDLVELDLVRFGDL